MRGWKSSKHERAYCFSLCTKYSKKELQRSYQTRLKQSILYGQLKDK